MLTSVRDVAFYSTLLKSAATLTELGEAAKRLNPIVTDLGTGSDLGGFTVPNRLGFRRVIEARLPHLRADAETAGTLLDRVKPPALAQSLVRRIAPGLTARVAGAHANVRETLRHIATAPISPKNIAEGHALQQASLRHVLGLRTLEGGPAARKATRKPPGQTHIAVERVAPPTVTLHEGFERKFMHKPRKFGIQPTMSHADIGVLLDEINMIKKLRGPGSAQAAADFQKLRAKTGETKYLHAVIRGALGDRGLDYVLDHGLTPSMKKKIRQYVARNPRDFGHYSSNGGKDPLVLPSLLAMPEAAMDMPSRIASHLMISGVRGSGLSNALAHIGRDTPVSDAIAKGRSLWQPKNSE